MHAPTANLPLQLDTPAFFERVLALQPRVAVFDCDGTLWAGDAGSSFMRWSMEHGGEGGGPLLSTEKTVWLNARYEAYKRGEVSELAICGEMVQVYAGIRESALRAAAATFFREEVEPHIFTELHELITELQQNGVDIWAVSSTCNWVIEEGVKRFNIPATRVLAACVEVDAGVATDRLIDVPTDEGKVVALRRAGVVAPDAVFGNSIHDAAMLTLATGRGGAFPVNPNAGLLARSAVEGWPVFFPTSIRQP